MTLYSIGDMAQTYMMRRQNVELKQQMARLTTELSSGRTADLAKHLKGEYALVADLEHRLGLLDSYGFAAKEAKMFTGAMQSALGNIQDRSSDYALQLVAVGGTELPSVIASTSASAKSNLGSLVNSLNATVAGRALFSGVAIDSPALNSADDILAELRIAAAGQTTHSGVIAAVDAWFTTPGGGFDTLAYAGSAQAIAPFQLGEGESVDLDLRANNPALRDLLHATSLAALAGDASLGLPPLVQSSLLTTAGEAMLNAQDNLTALRADLGYAESRIEESAVRIASESTATEYARGELLSVDPYEAATRLESVQFQLETLYTLTVRTSRLSLMEYMR